MELKTRPKEFFYQLESLRGIAALLVVAFHCSYFFLPFNNIMLFGKGYIMVDLFFVLSGFVIYNNYEGSLDTFSQLKKFLILRIGRIYPLHFFTTIIWLFAPLVEYLTADYGVKKSVFSVSNTLANFLLIHNWGFKDFEAINAPSWSISTEFFAYIFFAGVLVIFKKYSKYIIVLTLVFAGICVGFFDKTNLFLALFRCLFSFSIGCIVSMLYKKLPKEQLSKFIPKPGIVLILLLILLEYCFRIYELREYLIFPVFSALFILSLITFPKSSIVGFFEKPALVKLGTLSYSIYMVHGIVITFCVRLFKFMNIDILSLSGSLIFIICSFVGTYIVSNITYEYIEKVFRDKIRKLTLKTSN